MTLNGSVSVVLQTVRWPGDLLQTLAWVVFRTSPEAEEIHQNDFVSMAS